STIGGCRVVATLGRGGVATVYRAEQIALHRTVALKVLRPGLAVDPRQVARFRREGLAIARLHHEKRHENVVQIHDVGQQDGHHFLVMELVEGKDLATALQALPDAPTRTARDFWRALRSEPVSEPRRSSRVEASPSGGALPCSDDDSPTSFERAVARFFATVARAV